MFFITLKTIHCQNQAANFSIILDRFLLGVCMAVSGELHRWVVEFGDWQDGGFKFLKSSKRGMGGMHQVKLWATQVFKLAKIYTFIQHHRAVQSNLSHLATRLLI